MANSDKAVIDWFRPPECVAHGVSEESLKEGLLASLTKLKIKIGFYFLMRQMLYLANEMKIRTSKINT